MAASPGDAGGSSQPPRHQVPPNPQLTCCMWCSNPLTHPSEPFCIRCGSPQNMCKHCQSPLASSSPYCFICGAPQQQQQRFGMCANPRCGQSLMPGALFCVVCGVPQDPVKLQQFVKVSFCKACSAQLFTPTQQVCHICGTSQLSQHPHMIQSSSQPPNLLQPSNMAQQPLHQESFLPHPNLPHSSFLHPSYAEQQHPAHEQQSVKRSPEGDSHLANKRTRTDSEQTSQNNDNSQTFVGKSGAVVRRQTPQTQSTSPTIATSAHGTPMQPSYPQGTGHPPSATQGISPEDTVQPVIQSSGFPQETQGRSLGMKGTSLPGYPPRTRGHPPPCTLRTSQPGNPPGTQGASHPLGMRQPRYPPGTQGHPPAMQGTYQSQKQDSLKNFDVNVKSSEDKDETKHGKAPSDPLATAKDAFSSKKESKSASKDSVGDKKGGKSGNKTVTVKNNNGDGAAQANRAGDSKDQKVGQADKAGGSDKKVSFVNQNYVHINALILQKVKKPTDSSSAAVEKKNAGSGATFADKTADSGSKTVCILVGCVYMEFYT